MIVNHILEKLIHHEHANHHQPTTIHFPFRNKDLNYQRKVTDHFLLAQAIKTN
jgi:hypothetical protein